MTKEPVLRIPIDAFVESYWPLSPTVRALHELDINERESLAAKEFKKREDEITECFDQELFARFGEECIRPFLYLKECYFFHPSRRNLKRLFDYTLEHGLDEHVPVHAPIKSRATLHALLDVLSDEPSFTLVDFKLGLIPRSLLRPI